MIHPSRNAHLRLLAPPAGAPGGTADVDLARALIAGAARAPELVWDRYAPVVHGIVSRDLGPDSEVEDVTGGFKGPFQGPFLIA